MSATAGSLHPVGSPAATDALAQSSIQRVSVPWYVWCGVLAVTSAAIGGAWDVSWHRSIGRDSFWTPAHMAIYACGVLAAVVCGYLIFATTFGKSQQLKKISVSVLGFRAPLGAFIAAWGGIAMLTSAPFDNWWHSAYGLDVKIVSPPHTLLILGIRAVGVGVLFLILSAMNRAITDGHTEDQGYHKLQLLFLFLGGLIVSGQMFFLLEYTWDVMLHGSTAYVAMAIAVPVALAMLSRASQHRWAATLAAAVYTIFAIAEILILPLFPAQPKLGPVFYPVTHLVPAKFPILIIVPALALDLLWKRTRAWKTWQVALLSGAVFVAVLVAVEWPVASFLMTPASANRFFGTMYFDYNSPSWGVDRLRQFIETQQGLALFRGLSLAAICASVGVWIGLSFGSWMRKVQR
ncbi:hypothetical protein ACPOL_3852 [Acidisarcina polymorpha]|uniref:Uncharacterized protein n=1 Tax=Acidisarcina polymorpha TaxID=2211140 RepID=A0A2Z5G205_9BACT|nr:hypothetical protein [Acidisarcina polymorpha]AXC13131.1 hypothetical protein ACPOL_3852 [Acidisarcina polymorpha]